MRGKSITSLLLLQLLAATRGSSGELIQGSSLVLGRTPHAFKPAAKQYSGLDLRFGFPAAGDVAHVAFSIYGRIRRK